MQKLLGYILGSLIAVPLLALIVSIDVCWSAWVLCKLWDWYMVTYYLANHISLSLSVGICCIMSILTKQYVPMKDGSDVGPLMYMLLKPALLLLVGYLAK